MTDGVKNHKKEGFEVKTYPVRFTLKETKENLIINTNTPSKEQIIQKAIKYHSQGNIQEAAKYYQLFVDQGFKDHRVFSNYGIILKEFGNLQEAEITMRKAIKLKPGFADAYSNLGSILSDLGKLGESEKYYRKAIKLKPDFADAHANFGKILKDLGSLKEAESFTRKAIELKPDFAMAYSNLGNILNDIDNPKEAEKYYRKAIELKPDFADAHYNLGQILKEIGKLKEAKIYICNSIKVNPNCAQAHQALSNIYSLENNYSEAYKEIERAIKLDPHNHIYKGELTRIKFIQGEYDEKIISNNQQWSDQDDYFYEDNNSDILLVSFGSMGRDNKLIPSFNFYNLLSKNQTFDKLFLRDIDRNYFLTGLKNSTSNLQETIELINRLTTKKRYRKIISIGASAGGFAAILFGNLLNFSKIIAFNPQTVITKEKENIVKDKFYTVEISKKLRNLNLSNALYQKCLNLKNLIPFKTETEIHYSHLSEIDKNHAKFIEHENCKLIKHNSSSHLLALQLRDAKDLEDIIVKSLII